MQESHVAYIGIGSNLGDRVGYVQQALTLLSSYDKIKVASASSLYETEPVGFKRQEWFINAVVSVATVFTPVELLRACQLIEEKLKRVRDVENRNGPRTIDLDILFYDDLMLSNDALILPHPRFHERAYAIVPMLEIAPDWIHPVLSETVEQLHYNLERPEEVFLYGTRSRS